MDGAFGRDLDIGESADQAFSDLTGTPAAVLALHVEDIVLNLKGKLMSIAIGAPAPVGQPLNPALLVAIEDLVPGLAGDPELSAEFRHGLAGEPASHKLKSFVHHRTLLPRHLTSSHKKGKSVTHVSGTICYLCLRSLTSDSTAITSSLSTASENIPIDARPNVVPPAENPARTASSEGQAYRLQIETELPPN